MQRPTILFLLILVCSATWLLGQTRRVTSADIEILKAEDARQYDAVLEMYLADTSGEKYTTRALLAAGRIGDERAVRRVAAMLNNDSVKNREMAAFALGEIESARGADAILKTLADPKTAASVRARAVEAAGKIGAANPKDAKTPRLGEAILDALETEDAKGRGQDRRTVLLGLTAALRTRPEDADLVVMKFLTNLDPRVRADAGNTLARLRTKAANGALRAMLMSDSDAVARANAARALGAAEDKGAFDMLLVAAAEDDDARVRVSAIRSLAALKDPMATDKLLDRGEHLLAGLKKSRSAHPAEINELLEIATVLGRLLPNTNDGRTVRFLRELRQSDKARSAETEAALARIAPEAYAREITAPNIGYTDWHTASAYAQGAAELAKVDNVNIKMQAARNLTAYVDGMKVGVKPAYQAEMTKAMPDLIRAMAAFKPDNLDEILRSLLANQDVFIRATAADLLGERPVTKENLDALKKASARAFVTDKIYDDAQLGILDVLYKLNKTEAVGSLLIALDAPDYLVRKKAFDLLADPEFSKAFPGAPAMISSAREKHKELVLPYTPAFGTKLGQVLNTDADYRRALARKNGGVKAIVTTGKGLFTIDFLPEDAPLTVDNFIKLARANYFNGVEVHRVVPNFVMQDGDPRGDGNGGPGWSIRCEINLIEFDRGAVGMALSGKDTGGSQWFVTHSPQPHLDGGYTVFGHVNEKDMKVVDSIVRGDKIISIKIVESVSRRPNTQIHSSTGH